MNGSPLTKYRHYIEAQERTPSHGPGKEPLPAITISREAGAGAHSVADRVAEILEERRDKERGGPWTVLDRELVEKVLDDHELPERVRRFMPEDSARSRHSRA